MQKEFVQRDGQFNRRLYQNLTQFLDYNINGNSNNKFYNYFINFVLPSGLVTANFSENP